VIKSGRTRWAEHVAQTRTGEVHTVFWWGDTCERDNLEDLGLDGRIILNGSLKNRRRNVDCIDLAQDKD
jgi:hypothetical protein